MADRTENSNNGAENRGRRRERTERGWQIELGRPSIELKIKEG
jgi:hypothetical protein